MIAYLKLGAGVFLVVLIFGAGFHFGGLSGNAKAAASKAALDGFQTAQAENTAKAVLAERAAGATESARVNAKLKEYEDAPIDPVVTGLSERVRLATCPGATGSSVPGAGGNAGGAQSARGVPASPAEVERLSDAAWAAADKDATRLNLCRDVWPK